MQLPKLGQRFKTLRKLGSTRGFMVGQASLDTRRSSETVIYRGYFPGHGGDVWCCENTDGSMAAYAADELVLLGTPTIEPANADSSDIADVERVRRASYIVMRMGLNRLVQLINDVLLGALYRCALPVDLANLSLGELEEERERILRQIDLIDSQILKHMELADSVHLLSSREPKKLKGADDCKRTSLYVMQSFK